MKTTFLKKPVNLIVMLGAFLLASCAGVPHDVTQHLPHVAPVAGVLTNANVRIVAADGSFEIKPNEQFSPPFYSRVFDCGTAFNDRTITEDHVAAVGCGAKQVLVYVEGQDQPLFGVLALGRLTAASKGPARRSYLIKIPQDKINSAFQGLTTVSFEKYDWIATRSDGYRQTKNWRSWILWLSQTPLG